MVHMRDTIESYLLAYEGQIRAMNAFARDCWIGIGLGVTVNYLIGIIV